MDFSFLLPTATAFGLALVHSLWIGAMLYAGVRAILPLLPGPAARHHLAYGALLTLAATFSYTLYLFYDPTPVCENLVAGGTVANGTGVAGGPTAADLPWAEWWNKQLAFWAPWFSGAYLVGLIPALLFLIRDQGRVSSLRHNGLSELPVTWSHRLEQVLARHPLTRRVKCYLSDQVGEVMTLGFWSPVIVFPVALVNELTPEMARTILLHEIAHLRHYDHWLNYPQQIIRAFFFFHPAAHALCQLIDREREHRCDDWVASRCRDRRTYASALVTVARTSHIPPNKLVMSATKTPFSQRIQRLFQGDNTAADRNFAFSLLLVVLLSGAHLAYTSLGADAGAADCLEEQNKPAQQTAMGLPLLLFQPQPPTGTLSSYRLSKLNADPSFRWIVTEPDSEAEPAPCATRLSAAQLPYIAAPEAPESSNPQAMEAYERARLKYEEMQEKTQHRVKRKFSLLYEVQRRALQPALNEQLALRPVPCPPSNRKTTAQSPLTSDQPLRAVKLLSERSAAPGQRVTSLKQATGLLRRKCPTVTPASPADALASRTPAEPTTELTLDQTASSSGEQEVKLRSQVSLAEVMATEKEAPGANHETTAATLPGKIIYLIDGEEVDETVFTSLKTEDIEFISVYQDDQLPTAKGCPQNEGMINVTTKNHVL